LVDTGALYSVLPTSDLESLGVARLRREVFGLADGTTQEYDVGEAFLELGTKCGTSPVVFAPEGVTPLVGVVTLESFGLMVNPITRELLPMRLFLAAFAPHVRSRVQRAAA
jgi:predicted aspartyl protease